MFQCASRGAHQTHTDSGLDLVLRAITDHKYDLLEQFVLPLNNKTQLSIKRPTTCCDGTHTHSEECSHTVAVTSDNKPGLFETPCKQNGISLLSMSPLIKHLVKRFGNKVYKRDIIFSECQSFEGYFKYTTVGA